MSAEPDSQKPGPAGPQPPASDAASRYLDLWERHLSLTASGGPYAPKADDTGPAPANAETPE